LRVNCVFLESDEMKTKQIIITTIALLTLTQPCFPALNAYLTLSGNTTGPIYGSSTVAGREDTIEVIAFNHIVTAAMERSTCQPNGAKTHLPIKITKPVDKATPLLMQAMEDNDEMTGKIEFYRPPSGSGGADEHYYTIEFNLGKIAGIHKEMLNTLNPDRNSWPMIEHISFTYETIGETWEPDSIAALNILWESQCGQHVLTSDLNHDGTVNLADLAIMAKEWTNIGI
jgi:type VI secretion system secreted protein Hcp